MENKNISLIVDDVKSENNINTLTKEETIVKDINNEINDIQNNNIFVNVGLIRNQFRKLITNGVTNQEITKIISELLKISKQDKKSFIIRGLFETLKFENTREQIIEVAAQLIKENDGDTEKIIFNFFSSTLNKQDNNDFVIKFADKLIKQDDLDKTISIISAIFNNISLNTFTDSDTIEIFNNLIANNKGEEDLIAEGLFKSLYSQKKDTDYIANFTQVLINTKSNADNIVEILLGMFAGISSDSEYIVYIANKLIETNPSNLKDIILVGVYGSLSNDVKKNKDVIFKTTYNLIETNKNNKERRSLIINFFNEILNKDNKDTDCIANNISELIKSNPDEVENIIKSFLKNSISTDDDNDFPIEVFNKLIEKNPNIKYVLSNFFIKYEIFTKNSNNDNYASFDAQSLECKGDENFANNIRKVYLFTLLSQYMSYKEYNITANEKEIENLKVAIEYCNEDLNCPGKKLLNILNDEIDIKDLKKLMNDYLNIRFGEIGLQKYGEFGFTSSLMLNIMLNANTKDLNINSNKIKSIDEDFLDKLLQLNTEITKETFITELKKEHTINTNLEIIKAHLYDHCFLVIVDNNKSDAILIDSSGFISEKAKAKQIDKNLIKLFSKDIKTANIDYQKGGTCWANAVAAYIVINKKINSGEFKNLDDIEKAFSRKIYNKIPDIEKEIVLFSLKNFTGKMKNSESNLGKYIECKKCEIHCNLKNLIQEKSSVKQALKELIDKKQLYGYELKPKSEEKNKSVFVSKIQNSDSKDSDSFYLKKIKTL